MADRLLLDTCVLIWLSLNQWIKTEALTAIERARKESTLCLSVMTAWELGMLISKGKSGLSGSPLERFNEFVEAMSVAVEPLTPAILVASSFLPAAIHADPIDRILIATAREHDLILVTRDRAILTYGAAGHVRTLAC